MYCLQFNDSVLKELLEDDHATQLDEDAKENEELASKEKGKKKRKRRARAEEAAESQSRSTSPSLK